MPGESKSSPRRIDGRERQRQALELRKSGATLEAIAEAVGYRSRQAAHDSIKRALAAIPRLAAQQLRDLDVDRLDRLIFAMWPRALRGDAEAVNSVLRILAQRARLLGLEVKEPVPGSSRDHPLYTQPTEAVDLSAATDADLDAIIEKARAIQEAGRIAVAATTQQET